MFDHWSREVRIKSSNQPYSAASQLKSDHSIFLVYGCGFFSMNEGTPRIRSREVGKDPQVLRI